MTTLTAPFLERRLLQTVKEEVEARSVRDWPQDSVELGLTLFQRSRATTARMRKELQALLTKGVEARSFSRHAAPLLAAAEDFAASIRELIEKLSSSNDSDSARLLAELRLLEQEEKAYRDLLSEALARVAAPSPALDWDRLKSEADADFAAGRSVTFTTAEELSEGLAGPD